MMTELKGSTAKRSISFFNNLILLVHVNSTTSKALLWTCKSFILSHEVKLKAIQWINNFRDAKTYMNKTSVYGTFLRMSNFVLDFLFVTQLFKSFWERATIPEDA